jgi:geranylgeranyl diphosphate synthase type I
MTDQLNTLMQQMLPVLETDMRLAFGGPERAPAAYYGMMQYHMGWLDEELQPITLNSGKRIRPIACLLSCAAAGGAWERALPAGSAIEILHNFSLVHDDIEDASPTRRGRPTVYALWGEPQAINAGDGMFTVAHLAMSRLLERGVEPPIIVRALRRFDETALRLTEGQFLDMDFETRDGVEVDEYLEMITGKTAVLLSLSSELGALIAGASPQTVAHYAALGLNLGLAFQVIDDILGIWGDESKTGKSASTDIITKKKTLPVLYGLQQSPALRELYKTSGADDHFVTAVVSILDSVNARDFAEAQAAQYSHRALTHLEAAKPQGAAGEALQQLAHMLLQRDN